MRRRAYRVRRISVVIAAGDKRTLCGHGTNGLVLFVRHETQIGEYHETRKETGEAVDGRRDQAIAVTAKQIDLYTIYATRE